MRTKTIIVYSLLFFFHLPVLAQKPAIGIVNDFEKDSLIHHAGYLFLSESISKCFSPKNVSDQQFKRNLLIFKRLKTPLLACNLFIPGDMKLVGPDVHESDIISFAEIVFERSRRAEMKLIVWGSGGARRIPDGFDRKHARQQFISIARKLAILAKDYGITIALESLNHTETNFINTLQEAYDIVREVDHPNLRLNADIYHMLKEDEPPSVIAKAASYIVHCEVAEKEGRTPPGVHAEDFRPYLLALKKVHYKGKIMLECRWENITEQAGPARIYLQTQVDEVFGK